MNLPSILVALGELAAGTTFPGCSSTWTVARVKGVISARTTRGAVVELYLDDYDGESAAVGVVVDDEEFALGIQDTDEIDEPRLRSFVEAELPALILAAESAVLEHAASSREKELAQEQRRRTAIERL